MTHRPEEDLAVIRRWMEDTRREVVDRGKHLLIWGIISVVGLSATYAFLVDALPWDPRWVWGLLLAAGWAASMIVGWRDGRGARVSSLGRRLLSNVWVGLGVTLTLVGVAGIFGGVVSHLALPGLLSVVLAGGFMATSLLVDERWLAWVAVGWWVGGGVMLFVPGVYTLLLMAGMSLLLMVGPGVVLYGRSRSGPAAPEAAGEAA